jgi:DNA mismatch repair protein MutL
LGLIKLLSDDVKQKIAAGEVIEGPFSIVKELIENSLDANSTQIDIQITDSGLKKILIKDNGDGIYKDDIKLAITEHATSKIEEVYDIEKIKSYGFRGEALSSISSVSKLTILSRRKEEEMGAKLENHFGKITISDYAGPAGTTIIVENLFYNIPARKKFLKAKRTEVRFIREIFLKIALPAFKTGFSFEIDEKRHISLNKTDKLDIRLKQIYGTSILDELYYVNLEDLKIKISGFLSKPEFMKSSRSMQQLYVNNRPIDSKFFGYHLSRGYEAIAIKGKFPAALIFIEIEPDLIDINIHPAKREIKIFDQKYIDSLIYNLTKKALNREHKIAADLIKEEVNHNEKIPENSYSSQHLNFETKPVEATHKSVASMEPEQVEATRRRGASDYNPPPSSRSFINDISDLYTDINDIKIFGILFNTYILLEKKDLFYMIDFHAAHERFIFDSLIKNEKKFEIQELIFPIIMEFPINEYRLILENISLFSETGFDIEDFSDNSIIIRAVPMFAKNANHEKILMEFIELIRKESVEKPDIHKAISSSIACHTAKRSGDSLSQEDISYIINKSFSGEHEMRCPHGRPYIYKLNKTDIARIFKRE